MLSMLEAMGPTVSRPSAMWIPKGTGQWLIVGLYPYTPLTAAGILIDPPVSVPRAT
jgi:hypothetical protein